MNSIMTSAITFGKKLFLETEESQKNDDLLVSGQTRLMNCKELSDIEKLKTLFDALVLWLSYIIGEIDWLKSLEIL